MKAQTEKGMPFVKSYGPKDNNEERQNFNLLTDQLETVFIGKLKVFLLIMEVLGTIEILQFVGL
ncbi:MAG: hypothetical protein JW729_05220 [Bacteroidales bacterium]|nr:hypothetical protein [Bacteroidales bacterium]